MITDLTKLREYNSKNKKIFYVQQTEFFDHLSIMLLTIERYLNESSENKLFLVAFDHCNYSPGGLSNFDEIKKQKIVDFCQTFPNRIQMHFLTVSELKLQGAHPQIFYYYFPEFHAFYWELYKDDKLSFESITKKFVSLNKRGDPYRQFLYKKLYNEQHLDDGYFSFLCEENNGVNLFHVPTWEKNKLFLEQHFFPFYFPEHLNLPWPPDKFKEIKNDLLFNSYIGTEGITDPTWQVNNKFYNDTFVSFIIETSVTSHSVNFSEKTFRSIAIGHPFLVLGAYRTLADLRAFGFDTFDDIFDTHYDNETECSKRIQLYFLSIEKILALSITELNDLKIKLRPRLEANRKRMEMFYNEYIVNGTKITNHLLHLAKMY